MSSSRPKIAAITTIYFKYSHAQHIVDRFLYGYGWQGAHHHPPMDLVSLYVDQVDDRDLSRSRAAQFPSMKIYPTIAETLTLGTGKLAVDGVVIVGEHGNYPNNEKGQTKYPRWEFFTEMVKVFKDSGGSVPVFNDKHLSWNWEWAKQMYDTARSIGFPLMAGSSLPSHGGFRPSRCLRTRASARRYVSATEAWTATISTDSKLSSAWWNGGAAARRA